MPEIPSDIIPGERLARGDVNAIFAFLRWVRDELKTLRMPLAWAKTPVGGLPAAGNALCTFAGRNPSTGAMIDNTITIRVWNLPGSTTGIPGSTYIPIARIQGVWTVIAEPC